MEIFNNLNPKKLINLEYLFQKTPPADSDYKYLICLFGFLIILALVSWFGYGKIRRQIPLYRTIRNQLFNLFFLTGMIGISLIFCRWQTIPYLGSRFFLGLLLIVFIIWTGYLIYFRLRIFPQELQEYFKEERFKKYLPDKRENPSKRPKKKG